MINVQKGLGLKDNFHLVRKQIQGMYKTKYPTEKQKRKYTRNKKELAKQDTYNSKIKCVLSDLISEE